MCFPSLSGFSIKWGEGQCSLGGMNEKVLLGLPGSVQEGSKVPGSEASLVFQEAEGNGGCKRRNPISRGRNTERRPELEGDMQRKGLLGPRHSRCDVHSKHVDSTCHIRVALSCGQQGICHNSILQSNTNSHTLAQF